MEWVKGKNFVVQRFGGKSRDSIVSVNYNSILFFGKVWSSWRCKGIWNKSEMEYVKDRNFAGNVLGKIQGLSADRNNILFFRKEVSRSSWSLQKSLKFFIRGKDESLTHKTMNFRGKEKLGTIEKRVTLINLFYRHFRQLIATIDHLFSLSLYLQQNTL